MSADQAERMIGLLTAIGIIGVVIAVTLVAILITCCDRKKD